MTDRFLIELRDEVAAAARRVDAPDHGDRVDGGAPTPPRGRWLLSAAATVLLVAVVGATFLLRSQPGQSAVQVDREGDLWVLRWDEPGPDPDEIRSIGDELGLDLEVEELPSGAYNVGRVLGGAMTGSGFPFSLERPDGSQDTRGFRVPTTYDGTITVHLGRLGRPGERWDSSVPATGPGGPFECQSLLGAPLAETIDALERTDVRVEAVVDVDDGNAPIVRDPTSEQLRAFADQRVVGLELTEPDVLWITVMDDIVEEWPIHYPEGC